MKDKLFDYVERDNWVFNLSGVTKLLCFLILSASVMFTYDIRSILVIMALSFWVLHSSGVTFTVLGVLGVGFALLNFIDVIDVFGNAFSCFSLFVVF